MAVDVVTVFAPRDANWPDYLPLLEAQRQSAERVGHKHYVVTDYNLSGVECIRTWLPEELMRAMIAGVIARLELGGSNHLLFVDVDCLINRGLASAFGSFDLGLTRRINREAPINNGAMYVPRNGIPAALTFFQRALADCGTHWGADQEAISRAAAPVPEAESIENRGGCLISFMSMLQYACVPKTRFARHRHDPYVIHFKGATKEWMVDYAAEFLK